MDKFDLRSDTYLIVEAFAIDQKILIKFGKHFRMVGPKLYTSVQNSLKLLIQLSMKTQLRQLYINNNRILLDQPSDGSIICA